MDGPPAHRQAADVAALYADAPCGLLVTNPDGLITHANRTFCDWIGRTGGDIIGLLKIQDLLTMGGRIFHQTHWIPLLQMQGSVAEVKLETVHRDGRRMPMVWNAVRRLRDGAVTHELAVFMADDRHKYEQELLLERRRAEELLAKEQEAQRDLLMAQVERDRQRAVAEDRALFAEQMMAIVSHDLRNPLSVIRMGAHVLRKGTLTGAQRRILERLINAEGRATRLIADLLDFSQARIGSGLQIQQGAIDLHVLVEEALEDLRAANSEAILEHRSFGRGACTASGDRLVQMLGNLVSNAIAYGATRRPIIVTSAIEEVSFTLAVHNEGTAIDGSLLPKLFDPMTRGGDAKDVGHSVGLGLFIVRAIAEAHGGRVVVRSTGLDGTTFEATFPRQVEP